MGELPRVWEMQPEVASIIAELKAGSEDAYAQLIAQYHQTIYSLVYRILDDPADARTPPRKSLSKFFGEWQISTVKAV